MFDNLGPYEEAWKSIIAPARQEYDIYDLGPKDLIINNTRIQRTDFRLLNTRGHLIECSFFERYGNTTPVPCVLYLHGSGCSRIEALHYVDTVLTLPVSFFCFDFSGCGKSEGLYTSVGWHEQDDLDCMVQYLYGTGKVSRIAVWGRSMGAITALLYAKRNPKVSCYILDSPFTDFKQVVKELVKKKAPVPEFIVSGALKLLRKTVLKKANFDIEALKPREFVNQITVPAIFGAAKNDSLIPPKHAQDLYNGYGGTKEIKLFAGDHNSRRPSDWKLVVQNFLKTHLVEEKPVKTTNTADLNPVKHYFFSHYRHEESNIKPLKRGSMSIEHDMKLSWLERSDSVQLKPSDVSVLHHSESVPNLSNEASTHRPAAESSQAKSMHYRRAATHSINVTQSFESARLAAKESMSPTADLLSMIRNYSSASISSKSESSEHSETQSEDLVDSSGLKDISSIGLNRSSGVNALTVKPFMPVEKVFGKKETGGAVSHSTSDKGEWSKKGGVGAHLKKANIGHLQNKKSLLLQVRLDLNAPVISSTQTARSSMTDLLAKNLSKERKIETRGSIDGASLRGLSGYKVNG